MVLPTHQSWSCLETAIRSVEQNVKGETKKTKPLCHVGTSLQVLCFHLFSTEVSLSTEVSPEGTHFFKVPLERREISPGSSVVILQ